ncbi:MAG: 4-alpha-glucanotransferase [Clostridiales bacterium]|nr:4-alpha-glucanotransferase [Clostridiales bacterium]
MRSSGILLHITSLPSSLGVGTLAEADRFIDFLHAAKQQYWQILPITPTDFVNSPYASPSAFAGNTLVIDADELADEGLVSEDTLLSCKHARGNDYGYAIKNKEIILREAFAEFVRHNPPVDYDDFCDANRYWLDDYALFCALKKHFGGESWLEWEDEDVRMRKRETLARYADMLSDEIDYVVFCQYIFDRQWKKFRAKLAAKGIKLIGDIPIYVAYDSADVWAHSELFDLTPDRRPSWVAGVPPDYFSADGQLWGNPLYNWNALKKEGYKWWLKRVEKCGELFDVLRIDHFRAFDSYYAIHYGETTARNGHWRKGVGYEFLKLVQDSFPDLTIIAEDLGDIPASVLQLRDKCGLAGMKVVQFAYDGNPSNPFLPQNFEEHCVAYLGTHDNDTTVGWWNSLKDREKETVLHTTGLNNGDHIALELIEILAKSRAELVIYSLFDITENDTTSRMNIPGTLGCWKYMAKRGDLSSAKAKWLAKLTEECGRE